MFVPIPDIQLPDGGEIRVNSTIDAEGNHAVVLHFSFPAAFPLDVVLPAGFHICKDIKQEVDAPAAPQICPICGGKGGHIEGHDGIMSGGGESVWVDCEACEGHGWVKPAPADPFMPSPEVRAALQAVFRDDKPLNRYGGTAEKIADWVRSWPQ